MKAKLPLVSLLAVALVSVTARADFHDHIGLQMWSVRANTEAKGLPSSLDLVKSWGMTEIEGGGSVKGLTPEQVKATVDAHGLKMISMHASYDAMTKDVTAVIKEAKTLGVSYVICPWIPHTGDFDVATETKAAADFNRWGEAFHEAGIKFGYHPHGYEFVPSGTAGGTLLDDLITGTKPKFVSYEMDVFWAYHGGGDPVKLLEKYSKRWVALHVKDLRKGAPHGKPTGHAPDTDNVAVGSGEIDWKAVLTAAQKVGVKYYLIEDETPAPLENIPLTLAYLRGLKL